MKRLFICDPMCALPFGHNVSSLVYYRNYLAGRFDDITLLGAAPLNEALASDKQISRFFRYYYDEFVPLENQNHAPDQGLDSRLAGADPAAGLATDDSELLFSKFQITSNDSVFFPSADYYGVNALLTKISNIPSIQAPNVYLRFIGVMENASKYEESPAASLLARIKNLILRKYRVFVSAETPSYADFLAATLDTFVFVAPYPETSAPMPFQEKTPFLIYAAGSARRDKGFFRLFDIFAEIRRRHPELDIKFIAQTIPDRDLVHERKYVAQLYALPGTKMLPATISDSEMRNTYSRSHLIILPYDPEIYRYRGSAVTFEAMSAGRPVLSQPATGFASQIAYYGLGKLCSTCDEYATAALDYYHQSLDVTALQCKQARTRFLIDINAAYREWIR